MNDQINFENLLKAMPKKVVYEIHDQLRIGELDSRLLTMMENYWHHSEDITNEFSNTKLNGSYRRFNKKFKALNELIRWDFFSLKPLSARSVLQPEWKKNDKSLFKWQSKLNDVNKIATEFKNRYIELLELRAGKESKHDVQYDQKSRLVKYQNRTMLLRGKRQYALMNCLNTDREAYHSFEEITNAAYNLDYALEDNVIKLISAIDKKAQKELKIKKSLFQRAGGGYKLI